MKFIDYGIIEGYNSSKKSWVINSNYNGKIFIPNGKIIYNDFNLQGNFFLRKNISGSFVFIQEIKISVNKNFKAILWNQEDDSFCQKIFDFWLSKKELHFNADIKWLLENCSENFIEKIINSNKDRWQNENENEFLDFLKICCRNKNILYKQVVGKYFFEIWKKSDTKNYDENLALAIEFGNVSIVEKALKIDYKWIKEIDLKKNENITKKAIYKFLLDKISNENIEDYNEDIKWTINHHYWDSIYNSLIKKILEFKGLYSNRQFVSDFRKSQNFHTPENFAIFLYNLWINKGKFKFNNDIKWILKEGPTNVIKEIIEINHSNWLNDIKFIKTLRNIEILSYNRYSKVYLFQNFIYDVWNSLEVKEFDENLKWLINNITAACENKKILYGKYVFIENSIFKIIDENKQNLLVNKEFIDFIFEKKDYEYYKLKNFIVFETCMLKSELKLDRTVEWLFENANIDRIKKVLTYKAGYNTNIIEKIYSAYFPKNNIDYYIQEGGKKKWSTTFIEDIENGINKKFKKLFLNEIEKAENKLTTKKNTRKETHSATDLANFVFCPVSYFINQKYHIDIQEQENVFVGAEEHQKQRLLSLSDRLKFNADSSKISFKENSEFFHRIKNSKCISQGHKDTNKVIYYSKTKKLSGIPDYIFQDNNGYFAVEEKYTFKKYEDVTDLYDSHKVQALAYLYGLDEFQFNEVFVLYWYLKKDNNENYNVYNYRLFQLTKSKENKEMIIKAFNNVESIQKRIPYSFPPNRINYNKCIRCNYFPFCEHKKGNDSYIELPPLSNDIIN